MKLLVFLVSVAIALSIISTIMLINVSIHCRETRSEITHIHETLSLWELE